MTDRTCASCSAVQARAPQSVAKMWTVQAFAVSLLLHKSSALPLFGHEVVPVVDSLRRLQSGACGGTMMEMGRVAASCCGCVLFG